MVIWMGSITILAEAMLILLDGYAIQDGCGVVCSWADGHSNTFSLQWLYNRRFTDDGIKERRETLHFNKAVPWPTPEEMKVERLTYQQVRIDRHRNRDRHLYLDTVIGSTSALSHYNLIQITRGRSSLSHLISPLSAN